MLRRLYILDFDGTLFNSPTPPDWWKDKDGWWFDPVSLNPPMLPKEPPEDWWIGSTVNAARKALSEGDSYVVLLTGRPAEGFTSRVHELLRQRGLEFDEVHLSDRTDTQAFKVEQIRRILGEHPSIARVDLWEDMINMVRPYRATVEEADIEFKLHKVDVADRQSPCTEDEFLTKKVASRYASLV
jgi:hypothetical protein